MNAEFPQEFLKKMSSGVNIGGYITKPCKIKRLAENKFSIILTEGKNRQIRRMTEACGFKVKRLHRIRIMNVKIADLAEGQWQEIPAAEMLELKNILDKQPNNPAPELDIEE